MPSAVSTAATTRSITQEWQWQHHHEADLERGLELAGEEDRRQRSTPPNIDGNNALWLACVGESLEAPSVLIRAGIDMDHQNDNGATCLMYAASTGKQAVVEALLAAGADQHLKTLDDFSALDMAASIECLRLLRSEEKGRLETAE